MQIKNIQPVPESNLLVFGGVYSNLQAIQKLKAIAEEKNIDPKNIICTGDIVAYCADPVGCIQLMRSWGISAIAGNVELQLVANSDDCACNFLEGGRCESFSANWYPYAKSRIDDSSLEWLSGLPQFIHFRFWGREYFVLHGGLHNCSEYIFKSSPVSQKKEIIEACNTDIVLAGHCGLPYSQKLGEAYWINAGVIGMPANDGSTAVWYLEIKAGKEFDFSHEAFGYDHKTAAARMRKAGLPEAYAKTLETGLWDNCEILPESEAAQQGKQIQF